MKYSLQSLMLTMVVLAVVFGRVAHLNRWSEYHNREAERMVSEKMERTGWSREETNQIVELKKDSPQRTNYWRIAKHRQLAAEYREAIYRPWTTVVEVDFLDAGYVEYLKQHRSRP